MNNLPIEILPLTNFKELQNSNKSPDKVTEQEMSITGGAISINGQYQNFQNAKIIDGLQIPINFNL